MNSKQKRLTNLFVLLLHVNRKKELAPAIFEHINVEILMNDKIRFMNNITSTSLPLLAWLNSIRFV